MPSGDGWKDGESRLKYRVDRDQPVNLPDVDGVALYVEYLSELGYAEQGFEALKPVSFAEIRHWAEGTGIELQWWKLNLLRYLSSEYASQANNSRALSSPEPNATEKKLTRDELAELRKQTDAKVRRLFDDG